MKWLVVVLLLVVVASAERRRYDGCELWQITTKTEQQVRQLHRLYELYDRDDERNVMFWTEPVRVGGHVDVMLCGPGFAVMQKVIRQMGLTAKPIQTDIQKIIDDSYAESDARHITTPYVYDNEQFNTYDDIMSQLDVLATSCPSGFTCTVDTIGNSYEGRPIKIFRIQQGSGRKAVWLDSLTHAREWLSGATVMGMLTTFINNYTTNADAQRLLDTYDWHIVPVVNPDGYVFSWTDDRLWRKNRHPGDTCVGTDLNRNYEFMWGTPGSSDLQCAATYRGTGPASEPETQAMEQEGLRLADSLFLYISYHTYSSLYLFSYGTVDANDACLVAPTHDQLLQVGTAGINALMATYGTVWETGAICDILYAASGGSIDWAYSIGIPYTYTPELRGNSFIVPTSFIYPSTLENWNALVAIVNEIEVIGNQ